MGNLRKKLGRLVLAVVLATTALTFGLSTPAHAAPSVKIDVKGGEGLVFEFHFKAPVTGAPYIVSVPGNPPGGGVSTTLDVGYVLEYVVVYKAGVEVDRILVGDIGHRSSSTARLTHDGSMVDLSTGTLEKNKGTLNFWYRGGSSTQETELFLYAEKQVVDYNLAEAEGFFTFIAYANYGGSGQTEVARGTNDAQGRIHFEPSIKFTNADIAGSPFVYTIVEESGTIPNWIYDTNAYTVSVVVRIDPATGFLVALPTYVSTINDDPGIVFVNSYEGPPPPTTRLVTALDITARKSVIGIDLASVANEFQFILTDEHGDSFGATNNASGSIVFPTFSFVRDGLINDVGLHVYTIHEVDGGQNGWKYDASEYTVTVRVSLIPPPSGIGDFSLEATIISIEKDGVAVDLQSEVLFTNEIIPTEIPRTGDSTLWLLMGIGLFALVGIGVTALAVRQRRSIA